MTPATLILWGLTFAALGGYCTGFAVARASAAAQIKALKSELAREQSWGRIMERLAGAQQAAKTRYEQECG